MYLWQSHSLLTAWKRHCRLQCAGAAVSVLFKTYYIQLYTVNMQSTVIFQLQDELKMQPSHLCEKQRLQLALHLLQTLQVPKSAAEPALVSSPSCSMSYNCC